MSCTQKYFPKPATSPITHHSYSNSLGLPLAPLSGREKKRSILKVQLLLLYVTGSLGSQSPNMIYPTEVLPTSQQGRLYTEELLWEVPVMQLSWALHHLGENRV